MIHEKQKSKHELFLTFLSSYPYDPSQDSVHECAVDRALFVAAYPMVLSSSDVLFFVKLNKPTKQIIPSGKIKTFC